MNSTKNKMIMTNSNGKKVYALVYTSEEKKQVVKKSDEKQSQGKKRGDRISNEIMGEFSRYGTRVRY